MNVEIQQRACEYVQLFDKRWDDERLGIFEPIPIKGDLEGKGGLFDSNQDRPDFDEGDQDDNGEAPIVVKRDTKAPIATQPTVAATSGNMIDLDDLLGGITTSQPVTQ